MAITPTDKISSYPSMQYNVVSFSINYFVFIVLSTCSRGSVLLTRTCIRPTYVYNFPGTSEYLSDFFTQLKLKSLKRRGNGFDTD